MKSKKVLIVDDNALNRKVFENILMRSYAFDSAGDGLEAIEKIKVNDYDLVLMDIQMPKLDGISALKLIKEDNLTDKPVIAVSAYSNQGDREYFLSTGFDDFIAKPVKPKDLLETIRRHLDNESAEAATVAAQEQGCEIDGSVIVQLLKFNSLENIKSVYNDFLDETENLVVEIKYLLNLEKFSEVGEKLHIIKGNSGTLGINHLFNISSEFEAAIRNGNFERLGQNYIMLEKGLNDFRGNMVNNKLFEKYE